jgi:hypothetical protein
MQELMNYIKEKHPIRSKTKKESTKMYKAKDLEKGTLEINTLKE